MYRVSKMVLLRIFMDLMAFKIIKMIHKFVNLSATFLGGGYFAKVVIEVQIWLSCVVLVRLHY